jgi:flagellar basal body P-ring formation protein FlgA
MTPLPTTSLLMLLLTAQFAVADSGYQDLASLRKTARLYVADLHSGRTPVPQIIAGELDPRLRLAACTTPLQAFLPASARAQGNTTVGVRCNGQPPWQVYVPVVVRILDQVLVATRPLARGIPITREDVRLVERDLTTLPYGYVLDPAKAVGRQLKQPLTAGSVLLPSQIEGPRLIHRGETVVIIGISPGLTIRMQGQALGDGAAGDWVKVRNPLTKKEVSGQVTPEGLVQVNL